MTPQPTGALVSFPKSGRTWLRLMVSKYLAAVAGHDPSDITMVSMFRWLPNTGAHATKGADALWAKETPTSHLVVASHNPSWLGKVAKPVLLVRDPAETLVSLLYHRTSHQGSTPEPFDSFLHSSEGLVRLCDFLAGACAAVVPDNTLVLSYDMLHRDTAQSLEQVLDHLGIPRQRPEVIDEVIRACSFDRMAESEVSDGFHHNRYDAADQNARRVRAGLADRGSTLVNPEDREAIRDAIGRAVAPNDLQWLRQFGDNDWTW